MKVTIFILAFLLLISIASARDLGDGCSNAEFYVDCRSDCTCEPTSSGFEKVCGFAFGWCTNDDGSCFKCDFVKEENPKSCGEFETEQACEDTIVDPAVKKWVLDSDKDGRWENQIIAEGPPSNKWDDVVNFYGDELFDCNVGSDVVTYPVGCFCTDEGANIKVGDVEAICMGTEFAESRPTENFEISVRNSEFKWREVFDQKDFNGKIVKCPVDFCPLMDLKTGLKYCVPHNSFWHNHGDIKIQGGDNLCVVKETATWTTRTSEIAKILTKTGEESTKDFRVYCDEIESTFNSLAEGGEYNDNVAEGGLPGSTTDTLKSLVAKYVLESGNFEKALGNACVLVIQDGYEQDFIDGNVPGANSQKIIFGIASDFESQPEFLNVNFENPIDIGTWSKKNNIYFENEKQLLFFLDDDVEDDFAAAIGESSFGFDILQFLRNPMKHIQRIFVSQPDLSVGRFDRVYLGKDSDAYFYSLLEKNTLHMKISGIETPFFDRICAGNHDLKVNFSCETEGDTYFIVAKLGAQENRIWKLFGRQLRLNNNSGDGSFYDGGCGNPSSCPKIFGFNATRCDEINQCEYEKITICKLDGFCPAGCTYETDKDCSLPDELSVKIHSRITKNQCQASELHFLGFYGDGPNDFENSHAGLMKNFSNLCLSVDEGEGTLLKEVGVCEVYEPVISLEKNNNSHIAAPGMYGTDVCLGHDIYNVFCEIGPECIGAEQLFSLNRLENAHAGLDGYPMKVCCRLVDKKYDLGAGFTTPETTGEVIIGAGTNFHPINSKVTYRITQEFKVDSITVTDDCLEIVGGPQAGTYCETSDTEIVIDFP